MLYHLFDLLAAEISGFNAFRYITLRAILAALTALVISLAALLRAGRPGRTVAVNFSAGDRAFVAGAATTPRDLALDFNAWAGAGWGLEASSLQSGPLRPHHRDSKLANLYLVGAGTHPGAGVPGVLMSAKALDSVLPHAVAHRALHPL